MAVSYSVSQYIANARMSHKKRILVEGRDDKSHVNNLLALKLKGQKVRVETAESIRGDCHLTYKNNRAKIEKIHRLCNPQEFICLYFLCDREFDSFEIADSITDNMIEQCGEGNLFWTHGHSFENYFIDVNIVNAAFRYLTASEFKSRAVDIFSDVYIESTRIISAITLAAKDIEKTTFPIGTISWQDFSISNETLVLDISSWRSDSPSIIKDAFAEAYLSRYETVENASEDLRMKISRGHTAVKILQRIFSCCLYQSGKDDDDNVAKGHAEAFSRIKESSVSAALCEEWLNAIDEGNENYPRGLVARVST